MANAQPSACGDNAVRHEGTMPAAIVLARGTTGIGMIRSLGQAGIEVHAFVFDKADPACRSKYCRHVEVIPDDFIEDELVQQLIDYSRRLGNRPAVFPTSDKLALILSRHGDKLIDTCRIWINSAQGLESIVCKDRLYENAARAGVPIIPSIAGDEIDSVVNWSEVNAAPYLIKPFFEGIASASLKAKNVFLPTREELLAFVTANGSNSVVIQRALNGRDGYIFDCYGLCDRECTPRVLASHRRLRQHHPDFGATCYGVIPAGEEFEKQIFELTQQLLAHIKFHGIFGIEWLYEKSTGRMYLIDFNARPFSTIGHLTSCGLNLPSLAYGELTSGLPSDLVLTPPLRRVFWVDFSRDMESFYAKFKLGKLSVQSWLISLMGCRSYAYFSWSDPGPAFVNLGVIINKIFMFIFFPGGKQQRK